jgi:hypothetical protein
MQKLDKRGYQPMEKTDDKRTINHQKYIAIRDRWDKEDSLLLSRTGIFLTTNSILCAASGFRAQDRTFQVGVAIMGLALSVLWLTTSWHSCNVIKKLSQMCRDVMPYDLMDIYRIDPVLFRPTTVFGKLVPGLIIIGWLIYIVWIAV